MLEHGHHEGAEGLQLLWLYQEQLQVDLKSMYCTGTSFSCPSLQQDQASVNTLHWSLHHAGHSAFDAANNRTCLGGNTASSHPPTKVQKHAYDK